SIQQRLRRHSWRRWWTSRGWSSTSPSLTLCCAEHCCEREALCGLISMHSFGGLPASRANSLAVAGRREFFTQQDLLGLDCDVRWLLNHLEYLHGCCDV